MTAFHVTFLSGVIVGMAGGVTIGWTFRPRCRRPHPPTTRRQNRP